MSMAGAGATGNTLNEFERFFGKDFIEKAKSHASVFDKILGQVIIANAIFLNAAVRTEFIKSLSDGFNAQAHQGLNKNFINSWCAKNTNRMIKDILIEELSPSTVAVIISVVYLKAKWAYPFKKSLSYKAKFNKLWEVHFMTQTLKKVLYLKNHMFQAIVLPYEDSKLEMVIVLPSKKTNAKTEINRLARNGGSGLDHFVKQDIALSLPRMELAYDLSLKSMLIDMGLVLPFGPRAEFSKICIGPVLISDVIHKAVMKVDEEGTVAVAATTVEIARCISRAPIVMKVDRPFLVLLRTTEQKILMFLALVNKPMG